MLVHARAPMCVASLRQPLYLFRHGTSRAASLRHYEQHYLGYGQHYERAAAMMRRRLLPCEPSSPAARLPSRKGLGAATQLKAEDQAQERARQSPARMRCHWSCKRGGRICTVAVASLMHLVQMPYMKLIYRWSTRYWVGLYPVPLGVRVVVMAGRIGSIAAAETAASLC
ncbi:uncharacterized protein Triagg1_916 [Trichoderma aggressivum f. europaeum]|uniref:Uncharacterized protein n=1 Tax=Trichoderma aggressivum f. europaeum TaxID=173218 RepID=A0AAE1JHR1_9HYPO|nr:hypothetical protein Triagg1_916 [Trichoderma aggressivum f. europaeum]